MKSGGMRRRLFLRASLAAAAYDSVARFRAGIRTSAAISRRCSSSHAEGTIAENGGRRATKRASVWGESFCRSSRIAPRSCARGRYTWRCRQRLRLAITARAIGGLLTGRPFSRHFRSAGPRPCRLGERDLDRPHIARVLDPPTPFRTLELGVHVVDAEVRGRVAYSGASQPRASDRRPIRGSLLIACLPGSRRRRRR